MARKRPEQDEDVVKSVSRKLYELFYGPRAYIKKEKIEPIKKIKLRKRKKKKLIKPKKKFATIRTGDTEQRLKEAGITKKDIKRLRD